MNRLILERRLPEFVEIASLSDKPYYDYRFNAEDYACLDLDPETMCMLGLRFRIELGRHLDPIFLDKPTYVLYNRY